jgi:hypothetical protein
MPGPIEFSSARSGSRRICRSFRAHANPGSAQAKRKPPIPPCAGERSHHPRPPLQTFRSFRRRGQEGSAARGRGWWWPDQPAPRQPHLAPKPRIIQQPRNLRRQVPRIPRLKKQPRQPIANGIRQPPNPAGHGRSPSRHRFDRGNAERILSNHRHQANIRSPVMLRQLVLRAPANRSCEFIDRPGRIKRQPRLCRDCRRPRG